MDAGKLLDETAHSTTPLDPAPRLSARASRSTDLAAPLAEYVARHVREYVPLRPGNPSGDATRDFRWRLFVNEAVEADL